MPPCIFCQIAAKEILSNTLYEDADVAIIRDKYPKAPTHLLIIPKLHIDSILTISENTKHIPGILILRAKEFASSKGIPGYKLTFHCGKKGGQVIDHLHLHLMADMKFE